MIKKYSSTQDRRQRAVRAKIRKNSVLPRLSVFRSLKFVYAQVIDDKSGNTLAYAKGLDPVEVGQKIAKLSLDAKIKQVVFDRGPYKYHGRIKKLADSARESGLKL
ncbi:MAG: 50S ribosomal protein L18 [Candidatus Amesbacteria bacterium]|nr:50S ribosomal protein L18 [Candidatus Amesbacteria bacterium]